MSAYQVLKKKYNWRKLRAKNRGVSFELTFSQYRALLQINRCYYTGRYLTLKEKDKHGNLGPFHYTWSLDRVDVKQGYRIDNVVVCAHIVNIIKSYVIDYDLTKSPLKKNTQIANILLKKFKKP